jgi:hypothetical protein
MGESMTGIARKGTMRRDGNRKLPKNHRTIRFRFKCVEARRRAHAVIEMRVNRPSYFHTL